MLKSRILKLAVSAAMITLALGAVGLGATAVSAATTAHPAASTRQEVTLRTNSVSIIARQADHSRSEASAIALTALGATGATAPPSSAATTTRIAAADSQRPAASSAAGGHNSSATAAGTCPRPSGWFVEYYTNCSQATGWSCQDIGVLIGLDYAPLYVSDGCSVRVWVYQGPGRSGYNLCITDGTSTGRLSRTYTYFWISSNRTPC
jgi:hypothetical protein